MTEPTSTPPTFYGLPPAEPEPESVRLGDIKCRNPDCPDKREGKNHAHPFDRSRWGKWGKP